MPASLRVITALARLASSEALHKRVLLLAAGLTAAYVVLFGLGMHSIVGAGSSLDQLGFTQLFNMALYLAALLASLLAAFTAMGAVSGEIESGTALALVTKPVSRRTVLPGKFLGYAVMLAAYAALFSSRSGELLPGRARW